MPSAAEIGCAWRIDFGYREADLAGVPHEKLRDVPTWEEPDAYTATERQVVAYASSNDPEAAGGAPTR